MYLQLYCKSEYITQELIVSWKLDKKHISCGQPTLLVDTNPQKSLF